MSKALAGKGARLGLQNFFYLEQEIGPNGEVNVHQHAEAEHQQDKLQLLLLWVPTSDQGKHAKAKNQQKKPLLLWIPAGDQGKDTRAEHQSVSRASTLMPNISKESTMTSSSRSKSASIRRSKSSNRMPIISLEFLMVEKEGKLRPPKLKPNHKHVFRSIVLNEDEEDLAAFCLGFIQRSQRISDKKITTEIFYTSKEFICGQAVVLNRDGYMYHEGQMWSILEVCIFHLTGLGKQHHIPTSIKVIVDITIKETLKWPESYYVSIDEEKEP
ncbi:hypothetical protein SELMODRAFT_412002 [Selaginella moellendorffii]|uniref:Uncharacterized protein n=1 Tax=Selaginella moellendorffii TaxID=88036 RepID=D8RJQ7_SELML|nr:hypothetical protein SELMODRAFT_412002 [Selaginella moellendorffii]